MRALAEVGHQGTTSIEHEPEHHDPFAEVEISRKRLVAWLREVHGRR